MKNIIYNQTYCGEVYNAVFRMNRTQYRRQHQAIQTSVDNLGFDILFPKKITMKTPQINFILADNCKKLQFEKLKRNPKFLKNGLNHSAANKLQEIAQNQRKQETMQPEEENCFVTPLNIAQIPSLRREVSKDKIRLEHEFYLKQGELPAYGSGMMDAVNNNKLQRKKVNKLFIGKIILLSDYFSFDFDKYLYDYHCQFIMANLKPFCGFFFVNWVF